MDKTAIYIITAIILVAALFFVWQSGFLTKAVNIPEGTILFYGEGCPHCKVVDDFITQNKVEEKVKFARLEVWNNKYNQKILTKAAEICNIKTDTVGVPFLFDKNKCFVGQIEVIDFFKNAAGIK